MVQYCNNNTVFVPHRLTNDKIARGMETSGDVITRIDSFCETPSHEMRPGAISSLTFPPPKNSSLQKSKVNTMLIAFFNNGIIHIVPVGKTVNATLYEQVLKQLLNANASAMFDKCCTGLESGC
ncbi:hypothetical protein PR048_022323 [Dryococelus australis]|uniref:Uncharacterized protein n=1 Tax=Dryococelus australis TaxID=614101 RepID=A0ABQ9H0Q6_9NEOP|nr:hypothetical protein PR048_022323 [Dryococelus australis]